MIRLSLIVCLAACIGVSTALIRRGRTHNEKPSNGKPHHSLNYCFGLLDTTNQCDLSSYDTIGILYNPDHAGPGSVSKFLEGVRTAGWDNFCIELSGALSCTVGMLETAVRECPEMFAEKFRTDKTIPIVSGIETFARELCATDNIYGINIQDHVYCFTNLELIHTIVGCFEDNRKDTTPDSFISCVELKMKSDYPDICNNESRHLFDQATRRLDSILAPLILGSDRRELLKKLTKFF